MKKEKRQEDKKDLKKQLEKEIAEIKEEIEAIESAIENLDATEESVGYKAKEELSETLKELKEKSVNLQEKGGPNLGVIIGGILGGGALGAGAIAVGAGEKGGEGVAAGSGVSATKEIGGDAAKKMEEKNPENVAEKKKEGANTKQSKRTKSAKKRRLCAATRRRRDLKTGSSQIHRHKSLFLEQENFSRIRKALKGFLGPTVGIRTLDPSWYMQLMSDEHDTEGKNIFEIEGVLGQSFLLNKESSYFAMLDKMTHVLSSDLDAFPLSAYELRSFCECQREISQDVPILDRAAFFYSEPTMIATCKDFEDELNADTTNNWSKRLCIGEKEVFLRFSEGFYSYLDPENVYVNQIQDSIHLREVIYALHESSVCF